MSKKIKELEDRLDILEKNADYHMELIRLIMDYLEVKVVNRKRVIVKRENKDG